MADDERAAHWSEDISSKRHDPLAPAGFLTMPMVMERTGLSRTEVNSLIHRSILRSTKRNYKNYALFAEADVAALAARPIKKFAKSKSITRHAVPAYTGPTTVLYSNDEGAQVFRMIHAGKSQRDIVMETAIHPAVVQAIARDYAACDGGIYITKKSVDEISTFSLECELPILTEFQIVEALRSASGEHMCPRCRKDGVERPRSKLCGPCAKVRVLSMMESKKAPPAEQPEAPDNSAGAGP